MRTVILIPPSEGKTAGGRNLPLKEVGNTTHTLLAELNALKDHAKVLGVKAAALEKAITANKTILVSKTLPAIERYSGVVYQGLDYASLSLEEKKYAAKTVKVASGLFGLVGLQDNIPDYKLPMSKLQAHRLWLAENSQQLEGCFVIDLLPGVHRKAVAYANGVRVEFVIMKNSKKIPAGHSGKFIKGRFLRWLVQNKITTVNEFAKFTEDGFLWNGKEFVKKITS